MEFTRLYIRIFYVYTIDGRFTKSFKTVCKQSPAPCIYINGKIFNLLNDISGGKPFMNDSEIVKQYRKYEPFFSNWHIKRFIGEG